MQIGWLVLAICSDEWKVHYSIKYVGVNIFVVNKQEAEGKRVLASLNISLNIYIICSVLINALLLLSPDKNQRF
jgi:hypothetical protein